MIEIEGDVHGDFQVGSQFKVDKLRNQVNEGMHVQVVLLPIIVHAG